MNIVLDREVKHAITESWQPLGQLYRTLVATDVVANLFGHSELVFDTVYHFVAENSDGYGDSVEQQLYASQAHGYGLVTLFRFPEPFAAEFQQRVGVLFQVLAEGSIERIASLNPQATLHYQESGSLSVYMKVFGNELWAFVIDDARNYDDFAMLNPDAQTVDLGALGQEVAEVFCATNHSRVIRISGDMNSDHNFAHWLSQTNRSLYHQLIRLNVIGEVTTGQTGERAPHVDNFE